ncbi:SgcJ/EcaC family oxidoreductase [Gordonia sp. ABSL49_1]|uniref:YybH family protein n=1 Tax=unclassified Gordonia (in: high G+C Gram-positive bacteria) TaxID=2657482 RepID=UPI001F0D1FED|nr:SgcJ/EcaC family oxidoreductase [Gordonia sp. ABSL49_1]MCH5643860.1 SgcJ/EcaC family oxidoreductase [Gordonia sp. ABSL49_1]
MTRDRPSLNLYEPGAFAAVDALMATLQAGMDNSDADTYDAMFADDIVWGSPKGAVLRGHAPLNEIHHQLFAKQVAPPSDFSVTEVINPAPGVAVAHIGRHARGGGFSEMAMYVLVERDGSWWVAAGQNTPIAAELPTGVRA